MNYVNDVLKMLGVEVGEDFKVKKHGIIIEGLHHFDNNLYIYKRSENDKKYYQSGEVSVYGLLVNECEIIKLPYKPKKGDKYFYYSDRDWNDTVICEEWFNDATDLAMWKVGNVFKTKEEALEKGKELFEKLKKEYGDC